MRDQPISEELLLHSLPAIWDKKLSLWRIARLHLSGEILAESAVRWLREHPEVDVRAVVPMAVGGEIRELWIVPR